MIYSIINRVIDNACSPQRFEETIILRTSAELSTVIHDSKAHRKTTVSSEIVIDTFTVVPVDRRRFVRAPAALHLDSSSPLWRQIAVFRISLCFRFLSPIPSKAINSLYSFDAISICCSILYVSLLITKTRLLLSDCDFLINHRSSFNREKIEIEVANVKLGSGISNLWNFDRCNRTSKYIFFLYRELKFDWRLF